MGPNNVAGHNTFESPPTPMVVDCLAASRGPLSLSKRLIPTGASRDLGSLCEANYHCGRSDLEIEDRWVVENTGMDRRLMKQSEE